MSAPTVLIVLPTAFCGHCQAPGNPGEDYCSGECDAATLLWPRNPEEDEPSFQCPVCRGWSDTRGPCNKWCYDAWTCPEDEDPRL